MEGSSAEAPGPFSVSQGEIDAELCRGSGYQDGKLRIYAMYLGMPDTKAALAFLKREYGSYYGHSQTYQDGSSGIVNYSPKGITFQRFSPSGSFSITWNRAAARLKELVSGQDYFTPAEKERWDAIVREFQQRGEALPPPVPRVAYPPPYRTEQLTLDAQAAGPVTPAPDSIPAPPFHRQYLPEILRHEDGAASWEALVKFFADHPEETLRASYLRLRFGEVPHQYPAEDGTTIGFQGFPNQLHVWEGSISNPAAETRLTWPEVCLLAEQEIAHDLEQAALETPAEAPPMEAPPETTAETPPQEAVPEVPERPQPSRTVTQAGIDAAIQEWNGSIESKHAVVRYMREHGREKDTAAWLRQEYGDDLPAFPVTAGGAAADVPWPKVQRRIAQLIREDRFYTQAEQDNFDSIDPIAIREELARRGIVNGQVVDPEKLDNDPFIQQVMADAERIAHAKEPEVAETAAPTPTVREIYEQYLPIVREKVLADKAYQNACRNSDRENAMLEGAEAIKRAVFTIEDADFLRLYYDLTEFHNDLHRAVLEDTYTTLAAPAEQEARPEAASVVEPEAPAGGQPCPLPVPPYGVGDSVYLDGKEYKLLVLDEPTAGLDPGERIRFRNLISRLAKGRIILLATHIVSDVEYIAKEILLLRRGTLVMQGTPRELEQSIQGKVWEVSVNEADMALMVDTYCVSNIKQQDGSYLLRIVDDGKPLRGAKPVSPNLDDVFLHTFFQPSEGRI